MIKLTPKYFILPLLALIIIGSLPAPADTGRVANNGSGCGPAISNIQDPSLRSAIERFDRTQSSAAAKVCAIYRNNVVVASN
jgi:hypothetical protein